VVEPAPVNPAATMKPSLFFPRRLFAVSLCALLACGLPGLFAATTTSTPPEAAAGSTAVAPPTRYSVAPITGTIAGLTAAARPASSLVIANGKIEPGGWPATLTTVVARLAERYPNDTIILGDSVGEFLIPDLTIHFGGVSDPSPMMDYLQVIVAASNGRLVLDGNPRGPYTITRRVATASQAPRHVAVFNLGLTPANDPSLEYELKQAQVELNVLQETNGPHHPTVEAKRVEIRTLEEQIAKQKAELENQARTRLDQIKDILAQTLDSLGLNENVSVQFHPGANLLIVTGSDAALDVATKIVTAMGGTAGNELAGNNLFRTPSNVAASPKLFNNNLTGMQETETQVNLRLLNERLQELRAICEKSKAIFDANPSPANADTYEVDRANLETILKRISALKNDLQFMPNQDALKNPTGGGQLSPESPPQRNLAPSLPASQPPPAPPKP